MLVVVKAIYLIHLHASSHEDEQRCVAASDIAEPVGESTHYQIEKQRRLAQMKAVDEERQMEAVDRLGQLGDQMYQAACSYNLLKRHKEYLINTECSQEDDLRDCHSKKIVQLEDGGDTWKLGLPPPAGRCSTWQRKHSQSQRASSRALPLRQVRRRDADETNLAMAEAEPLFLAETLFWLPQS